MTGRTLLGLLAKGAAWGLALLGAVVAGLGGASATLLITFWAFGLVLVVGKECCRAFWGGTS